MIAIVALRVPALGFCLCQHELILNPGTCCQPSEPKPSSCECGEVCQEAPPATAPEPCRDCVVILSLDFGDFSWTGTQFAPDPQNSSPVLLPGGLHDEAPHLFQPANAAIPIRGSPPGESTPLYLRTQVLRL